MDDGTISQVGQPGNISPQGGGKGKKLIIFVVITLILIGVVFGGVTFLRSRQAAIPTPTPFPTQAPTSTPESSPTPKESLTPKSKQTVTPTKKPSPTPTKTATSSATTSRNLTVRVLNGSGEVGKAATAADFLKGLGYEIAGTSNADSYDYEKTTITIKKEKESLLATLKSDLATKYSVGTTSATLATSSSYDAEVIIGKQ